MYYLAFFPWLRLKEEVRLGSYSLLKYERNSAPFEQGSGEQLWVDRCTDNYYSRADPESHIDECTILAFDGFPSKDLSETEMEDMFQSAELLAIAGLSSRGFFGYQLTKGYCNRDDFQLVIRSSTVLNPPGFSMTFRRRDGPSKTMFSNDAYPVIKPEHTSNNFFPLEPDFALLSALLQLRSSINEDWMSFQDAIACFNFANTDRSEMREHMEGVLLVSSFEQLLGCRSGKEDDLVTRFLEIMMPANVLRASDCPRLAGLMANDKRIKNGASLREGWLRDLFRSRGNWAHGSLNSMAKPVWSPWEHLLLGSFCFPLLLKLLLHEKGFYSFTWEDRVGIAAFEKLLCADHRKPIDDRNTFSWNKILSEEIGNALF